MDVWFDPSDMETVSILGPSVIAIALLVALSAFVSSSESAIFSPTDEWVGTAAVDNDHPDRVKFPVSRTR